MEQNVGGCRETIDSKGISNFKSNKYADLTAQKAMKILPDAYFLQ